MLAYPFAQAPHFGDQLRLGHGVEVFVHALKFATGQYVNSIARHLQHPFPCRFGSRQHRATGRN
jgi:hypothetical protein